MNDKDENIKFSFEYYDLETDKYCISCWPKEQIRVALKRLKEINAKSFNELHCRQGRVLHFGEVDWRQTTEPNGFPDKRVRALPPFHFSLIGVNDQLARVYGVYSTGTFYIIWFDLEHKIWPTKLKNT